MKRPARARLGGAQVQNAERPQVLSQDQAAAQGVADGQRAQRGVHLQAQLLRRRGLWLQR